MQYQPSGQDLPPQQQPGPQPQPAFGQPYPQPLTPPQRQEQAQNQAFPYLQQPIPPGRPMPPPYPQQQMPYPQQQMPYPQQQPQMMPYPQQMQQPPMMVNNTVQVNIKQNGPGFFVRAIYFIFIGWYFGFIWLNIGFFLCALIITLPIGLMMLNRLPQVMTLKPAGTSTQVNVTTVVSAGGVTNVVQVNVGGTQQVSMLIRAIYFLLVGWWAGYLWACLAYTMFLFILTIPVGVIMFDRLPAVLTLRRN